MSVYKLFGNGTGGAQDGIAQIDIQFDGVIESILGSMLSDLDLDTEFVQSEISFLSVNTANVNDARGSLAMMSAQASYVTAASGVVTAVNVGVGPVAIMVNAGERVFCHVVAAAGVTSLAQWYLYVRDGSPAALRRRR